LRISRLLILLICASSCSKHDEGVLRSENPVLTGILYAGQHSSSIRFFKLTGGERTTEPLSNVALTLFDDLGNEAPLQYNGSTYVTNSMLIQPQRTYNLKANYNGENITSSCTIPPALILVNISQNNIDIDESSEGSPVTNISWNELDNEKYSYALKLENLEEVKTPIPFEVPSGNFERLYDSPVLNSAVTLFDTDFKYYGQHRLTVYAIERSLENVYFYNSSNIRGLLQSGPDNIHGAQGYFGGVSSFSVEMLIQ